MNSINPQNIQLVTMFGMFALGFFTWLVGVAILVSGAWGRDLRAITRQTAHLAQKGIAEDVAGLVGNASTLLNALNEMVNTARGIGVVLLIAGALLMIGACMFLLQLG